MRKAPNKLRDVPPIANPDVEAKSAITLDLPEALVTITIGVITSERSPQSVARDIAKSVLLALSDSNA